MTHKAEGTTRAFAVRAERASRECPLFCVGIDRKEIDVDDNLKQVG
jgi:hypothetical protein